MKGMKLFLSALLAVGFSAASLIASTNQPSQKCNSECPYWDFDEIENFFNRPFPRMHAAYTTSSMKENDKAYLISIDLPGMDKKDISIETSGNRLVISGERKEESESKEGSKKSYRQFNQSFSLPNDANLEAITATSTNGVLKITVPKSGGKKVSKKIEIK